MQSTHHQRMMRQFLTHKGLHRLRCHIHTSMELLSPYELGIVTQCNDKAETTAYVLAIKRLLRAIDKNTAICAMIISGFNEIRTTLTESEIIYLGRGYADVFSRLRTLVLNLKKRTSVDQDLLNARHDLFLGLSEAHTKWVKNIFEEQESWFNEKTRKMERVMRSYADDIDNNTRILNEVEVLKAQIWLAVSHSNMIHNHLGMR
jgi:hypothetical protein